MSEEKSGENGAAILDLPYEVFECLFKSVDLLTVLQMRRVSKRFYRLVNFYVSNLKSLKVSQIVPITVPASNLILEALFASPENNWSSLKHLVFDGRSVDIEPLSMEVFEAIFANCHSLVSLIVEAEVVNNEWRKKVALFEKAGRLRFFRWFGSSSFGKRFEQLVCQATPLMTVAHMHSLPSIVMVSLRQLVLERWPSYAVHRLVKAWSRLPCLESLVVYWGRRANAVRHLAAISRQCPRLTELVTIDSDLIDDDIDLLPKSRLRRLDLFYNYLISDAGVTSLVSQNPGLISLGLNNVIDLTGQSLISIARNCVKLEQLAICGCQKIGNSAIETVATIRMSLQTSAQLPWLTIYVQNTQVEVPTQKNSSLSAMMLARARLCIIGETEASKPIMMVPLRYC